MRRRFLKCFRAFLAVPLVLSGAALAQEPLEATTAVRKPNVVLVMMDDVGFGMASTFGGPAETPALSQLAKSGLTYNNFHTTALCSPTRAALLTGRNHHRIGFGSVVNVRTEQPGYQMRWPKSAASVARVLHDQGYSTAAFGKWHNTHFSEVTPAGPFNRWPTGLGFDYFYGFMTGSALQFEPPLFRNTTPVPPPKSFAEGYHFTSDIVDDAVTWLRTHRAYAADKPYFLYFAPGAPHKPVQVPQQWVERYKGRFDGGWDEMRAGIVARQKALGVIPADAKISPRPSQLPAWDSLSAEEKKAHARQMEAYAAFMSHADSELGRLFEAIRSSPEGDNTLIMFVLGDNGAASEGGIGGSNRSHTGFIDGTVVSAAEQLKDPHPIGGPDRDDAPGAAWAWAVNAPFPYMKQVASHLGGTRTPLIVSWPAGIADRGKMRTHFGHVVDVAPTIYEAARVTPPEAVDGVTQLSFDGVSFAKGFSGPYAPSADRVQYFSIGYHKALYRNGWLASSFGTVPWTLYRGDPPAPKWELYNLDKDFAQAVDVARKYPEKLAELVQVYAAEEARNNAEPLVLPGGYRGNVTQGATGATLVEYYPRMPIAQAMHAPKFFRPHKVRADIVVPAAGASGVIYSNGGRLGGVVLYVEDGHLVFENNVMANVRETLRSPAPLPSGPIVVGFEYAAGEGKERTGILTVNGERVAARALTPIVQPELGTFEVGKSSTSPVASNRLVPFAFTGSIGKVAVEFP